MAQYGYLKPRPGIKPPAAQAPSLAFAAAGRQDTSASNPFGLGSGNSNGLYAAPDRIVGNQQYGGQFRAPALPATPRQQTAPLLAAQASQGPPTPNGVYDINTDPALLQIQAYTNMSDEQAKAAADKQRRDLVLAFGDPGLANSLGYGDLASAAGSNPTSTKAQLGQQRDRKTKDLTDALNSSNLLYSGYRVTQEQQAAQDYQNALAQAAGQVNAALGGIDSNLTGALNANLQQRLAALRDAASRAPQPGPSPTWNAVLSQATGVPVAQIPQATNDKAGAIFDALDPAGQQAFLQAISAPDLNYAARSTGPYRYTGR